MDISVQVKIVNNVTINVENVPIQMCARNVGEFRGVIFLQENVIVMMAFLMMVSRIKIVYSAIINVGLVRMYQNV
jgi:hypothetical protein